MQLEADKKSLDVPFGPIGYITYKRTYSRRLVDDNLNSPTEEFPETIERILKAFNRQLKLTLTKEEEDFARYVFYNLKASVAGRFLWQLGTKTVDKLGMSSLQNCAVTVVDEPVRPFTWTMDMLMLGCGVGYNIQKEYVYQLPKVKKCKITKLDTNDADFIVPDSREGWVKLLEHVLTSHFITGESFSYSTVLIRGKGAAIRGFGGVASGPEELCWGIDEISKLLNTRAGKKIRPIDALDIMNIIGYIVVAGNVRRSAQLAIGDMDDLQFLSAKRWDLGPIPKWRGMSNNSVVCNDFALVPDQFWEGYVGNGEPYGLINLRLSREVGRAGDYRYKDAGVVAYNPCAEQSLHDKETCCLAEIVLPNVASKDEFINIAKLLYKINKHSLRLKSHNKETEKVVHENMRMGIGLTGYLQATEEQRSWADECYEELRRFDKEYSERMGWPESIKLTTIKPSGTLSLLPGVTPGIHPGYSTYFIRRVRISSNSSLVELCRDHGYPIEYQRNIDGSVDYNTVVVSFPCRYPEGTPVASSFTAIDQLNVIARAQREWSDNSVSCTIYYKKEELDDIKQWLQENFNENVKTVSFLLHSEHGFDQAPYEEITKEEYDELVSKTSTISATANTINLDDILDSLECGSGGCPIR
jgi:ribonucleoside-triphosphate reductase